MSTLISQKIFSGPAWVLLGNPVTAGGAGLVALGRMPNVEVTVEFMRQSIENEVGQPLADGQYGAVVGVSVSLSMLDKSAALLAAIIPEGSVDSTAVIMGTDFASMTTPSMVIIPESDKELGFALGVRHVWIPGARMDNAGTFQYQLTKGAGTNADGNLYTAEFVGTLKSTDSDDDVLPDGYRLLFVGPLFTTLAADLVTNGGFDADQSWIKGTGWTIASDVATSDGSQSADSDLNQDITAVTSTVYQVVFTISNYSAGNVTPVVGDTEGTDRSANGTYTEYITCGAGTDIDIRADLDFVGNIDDVTVKAATAGWSLPAAYSP